MALFSNDSINFDILKERAFNLRWAEVEDGVIPLTAADMDFPVAQPIIDALVKYCQEANFSYVPDRGFPAFKEAIANALWIRKKEKVDPELILPLDSAARSMSVIAKACMKPGDEALVFDPVDFLFRTSAEHAGGTVNLFPSTVKDGRLDLTGIEDYITPKTRMLGFCNPHNPIGLSYSLEDMKMLCELSLKHNFVIMNDEIWSDMIYPDSEFHSILELGPELCKNVISVYGFSKTFGVAGLRIGCLYATDKDWFEKCVVASEVEQTIGGISVLSQVAGTACCNHGFEWVDQFREHLMKNRDYALERINKMPGLKCHKPIGTFVIYPDISALNMSGEDFVNYVRKNFQLAIVPGGAKFFGPGSEGHVRICLATSHEVLEEGLNRLEKAVLSLQK